MSLFSPMMLINSRKMLKSGVTKSPLTILFITLKMRLSKIKQKLSGVIIKTNFNGLLTFNILPNYLLLTLQSAIKFVRNMAKCLGINYLPSHLLLILYVLIPPHKINQYRKKQSFVHHHLYKINL